MKRIVAIVPDDAEIDLGPLLAKALDFRIERITDDPVPPVPRKVRNTLSDGRTAHSIIMEHYTPSGEFLGTNAQRWLEPLGYSSGAAGSALKRLSRKGFIRNLGSGRFQFLKPWEPGTTFKS